MNVDKLLETDWQTDEEGNVIDTPVDRMKPFEVLQKKQKELTQETYELIRKDICITQQIIRPEIAYELELLTYYNNPLQNKDENIDFKQYCTFDSDGSLEAWTDGSADKEKDYVAYGVYWGADHPLNYTRRLDAANTNNVAELAAIFIYRARRGGL